MQALRGVLSSSGSKGSYSSLRLSPSPRLDSRIARFAVPSRSTILFILSCLAWYLSSALSSSTSKALLSPPKSAPSRSASSPFGQHADHLLEAPAAGSVVQDQLPASPHEAAVAPFPYPVTLTFVQFLFVNGLCLLCTSETLLGRRRLSKVVPPTKERVLEVGQLSVFAVVGQALSSLAISRVPVSTVHTIKALSPLFTVLAYSILFAITYSLTTWLSLIPLTLGVMMACTGLSFSAGDILGLIAALGSTVIFVAQNIYSKRLLNDSGHGNKGTKKDKDEISTGDDKGRGRKLDKINILLYSSGCAAVLMVPLVLYYDAPSLLFGPSRGSPVWRICFLLLCNGVVHFAQSLLAFSVLALVSPVTYSVASLLKRVFVICFAIIWFRQQVTLLQWFGILLTFTGLYMYNSTKTKKDVLEGDEKVKQQGAAGSLALPTTIKANGDSFIPANGHSFHREDAQIGPSAYHSRKSNGLSPTAARYQHQQQPLHMSVSKISGSFGSSPANGVGISGPGSWVGGGLKSPSYQESSALMQESTDYTSWHAKIH